MDINEWSEKTKGISLGHYRNIGVVCVWITRRICLVGGEIDISEWRASFSFPGIFGVNVTRQDARELIDFIRELRTQRSKNV